ncbi:MAG TPA: hypothetical protein VKI62_04410, partial [Bacteroidota bacterium]|nr:hypothetical protein [Bacteroidota bacterium]
MLKHRGHRPTSGWRTSSPQTEHRRTSDFNCSINVRSDFFSTIVSIILHMTMCETSPPKPNATIHV